MTRSFTFWDGHGRASYDFDDVRVGDRLVPSEIFVHISGGANEPDLEMKIEVRQDIPVWTEVCLRSRADGPDIREKDLRHIRLNDWLEGIVAEASRPIYSGRDSSGALFWGAGKPVDDRGALRDIRRARSVRPRTVTQERLENVAKVYRQHVDKRPTEAVSAAFGVSHRTAARYVQQARKAGLLPKTDPGKKKA